MSREGFERLSEKGAKAMESIRKILNWTALLLVLVILAGCSGGSYAIRSGRIDVFNDSIEGAYKSFSGYFYKEIKLEKGEIIRFCLDESTSCGRISFKIENPDGKIIADIGSDLIWEVPKEGKYRIYAQGDKHGGEFCLTWVDMSYNNHQTGINVGDVEVFIHEMMMKNMTTEEEIELIHQLQHIDRAHLESIDLKAYTELMEWLYQLPKEDKMDCLPYIFLLKDLDGAYAESYSAVVGELFLENPERFVNCLSCMSDETIDRVADFVKYNLRYKDVKNYFGVLRSIGEGDNEKIDRIVKRLIS